MLAGKKQRSQCQRAYDHPCPAVSKDRLLVTLGSLDAIAEQDFGRCLRRSKLADPDRASWTMHSSELREWLNDTSSRTLLINGNAEGNQIFSATSFITAKLLESLHTFHSLITLSFFCSLHTTAGGDLEADATGMVKSLITQLLLRDISWDLRFLEQ